MMLVLLLDLHRLNNLSQRKSPRADAIVCHHVVNNLLFGGCLDFGGRLGQNRLKASLNDLEVLSR